MGGNIFQHSQHFVTGAFRPRLVPSVEVADGAPAVIVVGFDDASKLGTWTLAESNLRATRSGTGTEAGIRLDTPIDSSAATYLEMYVISAPTNSVGLCIGKDSDATLTAGWWFTATGYMFYGVNGNVYHDGAYASAGIGAGYGTGHTIGMCIKAGNLYFSKNGVWTGNPSAGTGAIATGLTGNYWPGLYSYNQDDVRMHLSSASLVYPVPTGCTTMMA